MKRFTVALEPEQVERLADAARRRAVRERRSISWQGLLREAADHFLTAEAGHREGAPTPAAEVAQ